MKLGQTCYCPTTGEQATYIGIRLGVKCGRAQDGRMLYGVKPNRRGVPGATSEVRIRDLGTSGDWLVAEWLDAKRVKITAPDPVWQGAVLRRKEIIVR